MSHSRRLRILKPLIVFLLSLLLSVVQLEAYFSSSTILSLSAVTADWSPPDILLFTAGEDREQHYVAESTFLSSTQAPWESTATWHSNLELQVLPAVLSAEVQSGSLEQHCTEHAVLALELDLAASEPHELVEFLQITLSGELLWQLQITPSSEPTGMQLPLTFSSCDPQLLALEVINPLGTTPTYAFRVLAMTTAVAVVSPEQLLYLKVHDLSPFVVECSDRDSNQEVMITEVQKGEEDIHYVLSLPKSTLSNLECRASDSFGNTTTEHFTTYFDAVVQEPTVTIVAEDSDLAPPRPRATEHDVHEYTLQLSNPKLSSEWLSRKMYFTMTDGGSAQATAIAFLPGGEHTLWDDEYHLEVLSAPRDVHELVVEWQDLGGNTVTREFLLSPL